MTPQQFIDELKERFLNKGVWMTGREIDSFFDTIKAFLQKKNLVVVSKIEYEFLVDFREKQFLKDLSNPEDLY